jgi:hypothetical protein
LAVTIFALIRYGRELRPIGILAWTAVAAHLPMLFVVGATQYRYAMLGWDLSAIVTIAVVADYIRRRGIAHDAVLDAELPAVTPAVR